MFTGLVEELGRVVSFKRAGSLHRLGICARVVISQLEIGDSVAVNGVCLTVVELGAEGFGVEVMPETISRTNLGQLQPGDRVNLERALAVGSRLGGHLVSGHIDGTGTVATIRKSGDTWLLAIETSGEIARYLVPKGSIAVDGVSLTVIDVVSSGFTVGVIPHTLKSTTLGLRRPGDEVNLEVDVIAKYVEQFLNRRQSRDSQPDGLTFNKLKEWGYV